ncbi:XdhC family aldehyde oxidoreductase maturation factor [Chloroflexota bacterium]
MNYNEYITGIICKFLEEGSTLVLASIISQEGSAPRHLGTKMVIGMGYNSYGTIGGGLMEAGVVKAAKSVLDSGQSRLIDFDLTNENVNISGMICGGKATIILEYLGATQENIDFFRSLYDAVINGDDFTFITLFKDDDYTVSDIGHCLLFKDGKVAGHCHLSGEDLEQLITRGTPIATAVRLKDWQILLEPMHKTKTLYCFGAGHVAKPTAHIAALVGFRVVVVDDRAEFSNAERFPDAWEVRVIDDFNHALKDFYIDADSFIVIFTREHLYDRVILEQALKTDAGYIGMIASRRKRGAIYQALTAKGVKEEELARVYSPIGLDIDAETPEEIAVSIVAELIKECSRHGT